MSGFSNFVCLNRFEMETKAMLHRDSSRSRREEQQRWDTAEQHDKERIDREWQQAKRELEADDLLDHIADNPSGNCCTVCVWVVMLSSDFHMKK